MPKDTQERIRNCLANGERCKGLSARIAGILRKIPKFCRNRTNSKKAHCLILPETVSYSYTVEAALVSNGDINKAKERERENLSAPPLSDLSS
jgi:exoribonuclease II